MDTKESTYGLDATETARLHEIRERTGGDKGPRARFIAALISKGVSDERIINAWQDWLARFGGDVEAAGQYLHGDEQNYLMRPLLSGLPVIAPGEEGRPAIGDKAATRPPAPKTDEPFEYDADRAMALLQLERRGEPDFAPEDYTHTPLDPVYVTQQAEAILRAQNPEGTGASTYGVDRAWLTPRMDPMTVLYVCCVGMANCGSSVNADTFAKKSLQDVLDEQRAVRGGSRPERPGPSGGDPSTDATLRPTGARVEETPGGKAGVPPRRGEKL